MGGPYLSLGMWLNESEFPARLQRYSQLVQWAIVHPWSYAHEKQIKVYRNSFSRWVTNTPFYSIDALQLLLQQFRDEQLVLANVMPLQFWRWQLDNSYRTLTNRSKQSFRNALGSSISVGEFELEGSPTIFHTSGIKTDISAEVFGHVSVDFDEVTEFFPQAVSAQMRGEAVMFELPSLQPSNEISIYCSKNRDRVIQLCREMITLVCPEEARLGWEGDVYFPINGVLVYHRHLTGYKKDLARILHMYAKQRAPWQQRDDFHHVPIRDMPLGGEEFGLRAFYRLQDWEEELRRKLSIVVDTLGTPSHDQFLLTDEDIMDVVTNSPFAIFEAGGGIGVVDPSFNHYVEQLYLELFLREIMLRGILFDPLLLRA